MPPGHKDRLLKLAVGLTIVFALNCVVSYFQLDGLIVPCDPVQGMGARFQNWILLSVAMTASPVMFTYKNLEGNFRLFIRDGYVDARSLYINIVFLFSVIYPLYWYFKKGMIVLLGTSMFFIFAGGVVTLLIHI